MLAVIIIGLALFVSLMALAVIVPLRPGWIRITERFVCPRGSTMEVQTSKLSYHRPGERGLVVMCKGPGGTTSINGRAVFCLWLIFFICALVPSVLAGLFLLKGYI